MIKIYKIKQLDDASLFRHKNERRIKTADEEMDSEKAASNVVFEDVEVENDGLNTVEETDEIQGNNEIVTNTDQINLNVEIDVQTEEKDLDKNLSENLVIKTDETKSENEKSDVEFPDTAFEIKLISKM